MTQRDQRALGILGAAVVLTVIVYFWPAGSSAPVVGVEQSVPVAENRLARLRQVAATIPGKKQLADGLEAQLKTREKGLIQADTAAQAQAQLLQILRRLARNQAPPLEIAQNEIGSVQALGKDYGEALVSVTIQCRIEQLVNLLADITAQPELIATHEMRVATYGDPKQKMISVRLTLSGILPRRLVPERKGLGVL